MSHFCENLNQTIFGNCKAFKNDEKRLFGHVEKREPNNYNTHIAQYLGNQTMKFGHLIEYYIRNIFLEKSYIKWDEKTIRRPFSRELKLSISLDQSLDLKIYTVCFYYMLG